VGVVFPRCRFDRASDIPVASPSLSAARTPSGTLVVSRGLHLAVSTRVEVARGPDKEEAAKTAVTIDP
jgi:hypothetical protein